MSLFLHLIGVFIFGMTTGRAVENTFFPSNSVRMQRSVFASERLQRAPKSVGTVFDRAFGVGRGLSGPRYGQALGMNATGRIFGPAAKANNVVLVLDISSSMVNGAKNNKTYEILERAACNVISGLVPGNKFGVVVFAKDKRVFRETLAIATSDEKGRAIAWLRSMSPIRAMNPRATEETKLFHHGTRADLALTAAFKLKPDVIFFVSDGDPTGFTAKMVLTEVQNAQNTSGKPIPIHTTAYLADNGQQFMKDLAEQNRGTFREINPQDIK